VKRNEEKENRTAPVLLFVVSAVLTWYNFHKEAEMKSLVFLADGFEECEALVTVDLLRRAGITVDMVSINDQLMVHGSHGVQIKADLLLKDADISAYDVVILPGGKVGTANLDKCDAVKKAVLAHYNAGKLTCAICAAPSVLGHLGILKDKYYTCFPSFHDESYGGKFMMVPAVADGNVVTGRGMSASLEFAREILKKLIGDKELAKVEYGVQYYR
jgi:4-methyl-5(b-hydroxyethyl)-thiazole monophosphate biosynthesis